MAAAILFASAGAVHASVLASSNFSTGADGWTVGEYVLGDSGVSAVTHNAVDGVITTQDLYNYNGFLAPSAYLGDQSAALGGTLTFRLSDFSTGSPNPATPLTLRSGATTYFAVPVLASPSTNAAAPTFFSIDLVGSSFRKNVSGTGPAVTDAELLAVLSAIDRFGISADYYTGGGGDFVTLDDVVLSSAAVPEPSTWALMILGLGATGGLLRRRRLAIAA